MFFLVIQCVSGHQCGTKEIDTWSLICDIVITPWTPDHLTCQLAESSGSRAQSDPPHSWLMTEL